MKLRYYIDREHHLLLVSCGDVGFEGIFRLWFESSTSWEFCPPQSKSWDWYHQRIFRMRELEEIDALPPKLPPLPKSFPPPKECHVVDEEAETKSADVSGALNDRVRAAGGSLTVYVLLTEDRYESLHGDGVFHNFETAYFDRAAAEAHAREIDDTFDTRFEPGSDKYAAYVREVVLKRSCWKLGIDDKKSERETFDNYELGQICDALTKLVESS